MNVTQHQRTAVLKLFNISEAARHLGMPVQHMHRRIQSGQLPAPQIQLGRRFYYSADDLRLLDKPNQ
jgi:DNA-binding transcriptional MerR regulator